MAWVVANEKRTKFLTYNENDEPIVTTKYVESRAFDCMYEAIEESDKYAELTGMSPLKGDDMLKCQLR